MQNLKNQKCLLHSLTNIEITKYFNIKIKFNRFYLGDNLPNIKHGPYAINLDDKQCKSTHWISLFINKSSAVHFNCIRTDHILEQILNKINEKSSMQDIFIVQSDYRFYNVFDFVELIS